jgi:type IV pilus assembly protein PilA
MNMNDSSSIQCQIDGEQDNKGFTLIEILIAIVLIGILSAVAVVGISNLVSKGGKSACSATRDAATSASAVYFASVSPSTYPADFALLVGTTGAPGPLTLPSGVVQTSSTLLTGSGWTLSVTTAGTALAAPVFSTC